MFTFRQLSTDIIYVLHLDMVISASFAQELVTAHPRPRHRVKVGHNQDWGLGLHTAGLDTRTNQQRPDVEDMLK